MFLRYAKNGQDLGVALVGWPFQMDLREIAEEIYSTHPQQLEYTDVLIVRPAVFTQGTERIVEDWIAGAPPLIGRAPAAELRFLYSVNHKLHIGPNVNRSAATKFDENGLDEFVDWIREAELKEFVRRSSALFRENENFVYKCPSGKYSNAFLRVGNVQMGRHQIDAFFFWLLPYLKGVESILTDTWSISSISLNAARLSERYGSEHRAVDVEMLSSYHNTEPEVRREVERAIDRVTHFGTRKALFVVSTIMTGASLRLFRECIKEKNVEGVFSCVGLYRLGGDDGSPVLCDCSSGIDGQTFIPKIERPKDHAVIGIDRHTYFPLHAVDKCSALSTNKVFADENFSFFERYSGSGAISVHRNAVDSNNQKIKHHAFYVDVAALLSVQQFVEKYIGLLDKINPAPALIVTPPHRAGEQMAAVAQDFFFRRNGVPPDIIRHADLDPADASTPVARLQSLAVTDQLLILDDVSVSGVRLSRYQSNLRRAINDRMLFQGRIRYVIGVARPTSDKAWKQRKRDHIHRTAVPEHPHTLEQVELLVLPDWSHKDCPWCQELAFLSVVSESRSGCLSNEILGEVHLRRRMLSDAPEHGGLVDNAIWRPLDASPAARLTDDSIFLPRKGHTDADVLTAVAAVIQKMRKADKLQIGYPFPKVVEPLDYLGNTFNDVVLKCAILRGCLAPELGRWNDDDEGDRVTLAKELILNEREGEQRVSPEDLEPLRLELFVSMLTRKLPALRFNERERSILLSTKCGPIYFVDNWDPAML